MLINQWLIPSFYGDIRLTSTSKTTCTLIAEKLTPREKQALGKLEPTARSRSWIKPDVFFIEGETKIEAPIGKVSLALARALEAGRQVVSALRFSDGKMEEVTESTFDTDTAAD